MQIWITCLVLYLIADGVFSLYCATRNKWPERSRAGIAASGVVSVVVGVVGLWLWN